MTCVKLCQVFSTVTKPAEDLKATLYEWLERVDDEEKATTFYSAFYSGLVSGDSRSVNISNDDRNK